MDFAALADFGIAGDDGVRMYLDAIAKGDIGADDRKGANLDAAAQFCVRIDRRWGCTAASAISRYSLSPV